MTANRVIISGAAADGYKGPSGGGSGTGGGSSGGSTLDPQDPGTHYNAGQFTYLESKEPKLTGTLHGHQQDDAGGMTPNAKDPNMPHPEDISISPHHDGASVPYIDFTSFAKPLDNLNLPPSPHHADADVVHIDITSFAKPLDNLNLPSPHHADADVPHAPDNTLTIPQYDPPLHHADASVPHLDISPLPNFDVHHI